MNKNIKNISVFICICVVITLLLAVTNTFTAPIIEKNQNATANAALLEVMPNGTGFETVDISDYTLPATVTEVYKESSGVGYVIKMVTAGYGSDMVIMCGVGSDGVVTGAVCLSSNETLGKEKTYGENFTDKDAVTGITWQVEPQKVKCFRMNNIEHMCGFKVPLETQYAMKLESSQPIVVQYGRLDNRQTNLAYYTTMAF